MSKKALVVEDDSNIAELLRLYLGKDGFEVSIAPDGGKAVGMFESLQPDIVLLDIMLPIMDGWQVCNEIRKTSKVPIIMLTAKGETTDKVTGLEMGADDYITKPFRPKELVSRINSVLRRSGGVKPIIEIGDLKVDSLKGTVHKNGEEVFLSVLEYRLLLVFLNHQGQVLSRNKLLEEIWDIAGEFVNDNTLTVYVKRLREKIEDDPQNPTIIKTVRGLGYRVGD